MDRFQLPNGNDEPNLLGDCPACDEELCEHDAVDCPGDCCGEKVHESCIVECFCGYRGCKGCMTEIDDEFYCGEDCVKVGTAYADREQAMIIHKCEQLSDAWYAVKRGKVSASKFSIAMAGGEGKTRTKYMKNLLIEIDEQQTTVSYFDKNMENGTEKEPEARAYYAALHGIIKEVGFIELNEWIGGSPDGLVGEDGLIEIKCPLGTTHYDYYNQIQKPCKAYIDQMQGLMWITGRKWCDFISYRPESKSRPFWSKRYFRDDGYIKEMQIKIYMFVNELKKMVEQLNTKPNF